MKLPRPIRAMVNHLPWVQRSSELRNLRGRVTRQQRFINSAIQAARTGHGPWQGIRSNRDEDRFNKESMEALGKVLQRSQDLHVNNPDLRGFHFRRTSQIVGAHVRFKFAGKPEELGIDKDALLAIGEKIDRIRALHSRSGGFDASGKNRSEGTLQTRAMLTAIVNGSVIIHRVWRPANEVLPLSIELIPGVRISTPLNRQGDPKISYGIEYSDEHRSRVVAYHVRRVSKGAGDAFIPEFTWDRLPVEDCALLELPDQAGIDRSMPLSVAVVGRLKAKGEFLQSTLDSAAAQAAYYAFIEVEAGANPLDRAEDDATDTDASGEGFVDDGPVKRMYLNNGEKAVMNAAKLAEPDFVGFNDVMDESNARGCQTTKSRWTGRVNNSWAGGRLEDQQDEPIVGTNREVFHAAWQTVNGWVLDAIFLSSKIDLPGYGVNTRVQWTEFRAQYPGKLHINPVDEMTGREIGFKLRTTTPQQACEEDGKDFSENIKQWADAMVLTRKAEKDAGLPEGSLDVLLTGKTMSTGAGDIIGAPAPAVEPQPGEDPAAQPVRSSKPPANLQYRSA